MTTMNATGEGTTALIVDDEPDIRELIALSLDRIGVETHLAANLDEAKHLLERYAFDVCLTDMRLPDGNGLDLVRHVQNTSPELPIAVITAHGNMEAAVEAMKHGAFDFVSKPVDVERLRRLVQQATSFRGPSRTRSSDREAPEPTESIADTPLGADSRANLPDSSLAPRAKVTERATEGLVDGHLLVGQSASMRELREMIARVARTNAPVWITGESGTGKELVARLIHRNSARADGPFVAINCGAIPSDLMESEFFGHRKGSFTGAHADNPGLFRSAEGGTLFLDEVAELPLHMQVKLLRAIQERSVRAVGESEERSVDLRILSASHVDLTDAVNEARFRQDLYYRLNVISVRSPSLRERPADIPALIEFVTNRMTGTDERGGAPPFAIADDAVSALMGHDFPGNVRELENVLERASALCADGLVTREDLALSKSGTLSVGRQPTRPLPDAALRDRDGVVESGNRLSERERILAALTATRWNRKRAAEKLGITYRQLRYRIAMMGLDDDKAA